MALNYSVPGGMARKEGMFPPQVIRQDMTFPNRRYIEPTTPGSDRPQGKNPTRNRIYNRAPRIDFTV